MPSKRTKGLDLNLGQIEDSNVLRAFDQVKLFKETFDDHVETDGGANFTSMSLGLGNFKADVYTQQTLEYTVSFPRKQYAVDGKILGALGWYRYFVVGFGYGWVPLKQIAMADLFSAPSEDFFIGGKLQGASSGGSDVVEVINNNPLAPEGIHNLIIFYQARD
jgi:hypothetical protein